MAIHDIYSKRNKNKDEVFKYNDLLEKLKIQIVHIWKNFFKQLPQDFIDKAWNNIHSILCEEFGKKSLLEDDLRRFRDSYRVEFYFENKATLEECLDIIEIVFRFITKAKEVYRLAYYFDLQLNYPAEQAVQDLNTRFLENSIGFTYEQGKVIRVDNTLLHQQTIAPAFVFLNSATFRNANDEFLSAHEHFKNKRNKECLSDCLKALETTMKIICNENGWTYKQTDTAKTLIDICFKHKLIPDYLQTQFSSLRSILESGIPTLRNKLGGHGQGIQKINVPDYFANYMLYLTGTTIYFLTACQKVIKPFT